MAKRAAHWQVIRGEHAFTACEPQIRRTNLIPVRWADDPRGITCQACRLAILDNLISATKEETK